MDKDAFALMAQAEHDHWWFKGRRYFIERTIDGLKLPKDAQVLDAGCGSGGNLALLSKYGVVSGFEFDATAREMAKDTGLAEVDFGALPQSIPFDNRKFDLIGLFDVLEHLEFPVESLLALRERLTPCGHIVITVPALPWLWGPHDEVHQHFRRYTAPSLTKHLQSAGLSVQYISYMNTLLLPLAVAQRLKERVKGYKVGALMPSNAVNSTLYSIWKLERFFIPKHSLPVGLSLIAVVSAASGAV